MNKLKKCPLAETLFKCRERPYTNKNRKIVVTRRYRNRKIPATGRVVFSRDPKIRAARLFKHARFKHVSLHRFSQSRNRKIAATRSVVFSEAENYEKNHEQLKIMRKIMSSVSVVSGGRILHSKIRVNQLGLFSS